MTKLKIAYALPNLSISGGVSVVFQHANRLQKRGHEVTIATRTGETCAHWFPGQGAPIVNINNLPEGLDILIASHWSTSYEILNKRAKHKCYFVQSDETRFYENKSSWFYVTHLSYLLNLHYLTEAKWIQQWLYDNFNKKAVLVPNGLDREIFHETRPLAPRGTRPRILLEGAIGFACKGMKEAFHAVKDIDAEIWCISAYGTPNPGWKCDRFFNQVPMHKMKEIYSSCDILLKLSRVEGFFGPPLEMMACGGVCVVGKVTGYDEYIVDGENALVVDPLDIRGARAAVQRLIDDQSLRNRLRDNGFKTAANWNWESSLDMLERYFCDLMDGKYGGISPTQETTNETLSYIKNLFHEAPISPQEIVLRKIGNNKIFIKFAEKIFHHYTRWKSRTCSR